MNKKLIREWKKVYKSDLSYIVYELKDLTRLFWKGIWVQAKQLLLNHS